MSSCRLVRGSGPSLSWSLESSRSKAYGQLPVAMRHQCRRGGNDVAKGGDKGLDGLDCTPQVEGVGSLERMLERPDEGRGDIADILQVLQAAVADVVTAADRDGLDRLGRLTRHAEVSPHAVPDLLPCRGNTIGEIQLPARRKPPQPRREQLDGIARWITEVEGMSAPGP